MAFGQRLSERLISWYTQSTSTCRQTAIDTHRERERERERDRETETDRTKDRERQRQETERQRDREIPAPPHTRHISMHIAQSRQNACVRGPDRWMCGWAV